MSSHDAQRSRSRYRQSGGELRHPPPACNFDSDAYSTPLDLSVGQIIEGGKGVFNVFIEPQASVAYRGLGQPGWQIFVGFNGQLLDRGDADQARPTTPVGSHVRPLARPSLAIGCAFAGQNISWKT